MLTHSPSLSSSVIRGATGDEFSHACIAFNPELNPIYSFGPKTNEYFERIQRTGLGFTVVGTKSHLWGKKPTPYRVYVTFVNKENYEKMQSRLNFFVQNAKKMKFDFMGLIRVFLGFKSTGNYRYFCSRFVAEILSQGMEMDRDPSLYRPDNLKGIGNTCIMMEGPSIKDHDPIKAQKAFEKVKNAPDDVTSILESFTPIF